MEKKLITHKLTQGQESITEIPRKLYSHFYKKKISDEIKTETNGEIRLWFNLPTEIQTEKVIAIFTEEFDGDAVQTKFALKTYYPSEEEYRNSYEFEIFSKPHSKGWNHSEGNRFIEKLYYRTNKSIHEEPLVANHSIVDYISQSLCEMRVLLKNTELVSREFIDNAKSSPK